MSCKCNNVIWIHCIYVFLLFCFLNHQRYLQITVKDISPKPTQLSFRINSDLISLMLFTRCIVLDIIHEMLRENCITMVMSEVRSSYDNCTVLNTEKTHLFLCKLPHFCISCAKGIVCACLLSRNVLGMELWWYSEISPRHHLY